MTGVETVQVDGKEYTAVELELDNDVGGITVLDSELKSATRHLPGGKPVQPSPSAASRPRARTRSTTSVRLDVGDKKTGLPALPAGDGQPERFQLALETDPGRRRRDLEPG